VVIFKCLPFYHGTHFIKGWVKSRSDLEVMKKRKSFYPCWESNPYSSVVHLVAIPTELSLIIWRHKPETSRLFLIINIRLILVCLPGNMSQRTVRPVSWNTLDLALCTFSSLFNFTDRGSFRPSLKELTCEPTQNIQDLKFSQRWLRRRHVIHQQADHSGRGV
jgi:hypothetical protein